MSSHIVPPKGISRVEVPITEDIEDVDNMTERTPLVSQSRKKSFDSPAEKNAMIQGIDDGEAESGPNNDSVFVFCRPEGIFIT